MSTDLHIAFLGTSRSGLGHLRRIANIARHIAIREPKARLTLITNAEPAGLGLDDMAPFRQLIVCPTSDMALVLVKTQVSLAIADTMALPGMGAYRAQAALILRETLQERLSRFGRDDGRAWNLVLVPNAPDHWTPDLPAGFAHRIEPVGWIRRPTGCRSPGEPRAGIVIATGGGGNDQTRASLYPHLAALFAKTRSLGKTDFRLRQALGPRGGGQAVPGVDEVFDPGADLNRVFRAADVVISTAGYNSVLELASTDSPALLVPIPRSLDDQTARVALWGPRLGFGMLPGQIESAAHWLADQIAAPRRRAPFDLGPDGAARAAEILLDIPCPVS
ncbi:MAG: glycosyltransferase [Pseudorhodobacter sp.]